MIDMKKIAGREIVFTDTFIIPDSETVEFSFSPNYPGVPPIATVGKVDVHVKMKIGTENDVIKAEWGRERGTDFVSITLPNTKNRPGTVTMNKPIKIGRVAGMNLGFYAAFSSSGDGSLVTVQFVKGGEYE